jgi:uncharacterized membrane protein YdbT with pleckstrin-like domain/DNA-directed RNA polymerase subunit RPC12/RpoP
MSVFKYECPHCLKSAEAEETAYGQQIQCPHCRQAILLPPKPVVLGLKQARFVAEESEPAVSAAANTPTPEEEKDVFLISPAARAYLWQMGLGLVLAILGVSLVAYMYNARVQFWWLGFLLVLAGFILGLWVWIQTKACSYRMTTQRLLVTRGLLAQRIDEVELFRVKDLVMNQSLPQRLLGYGSIMVVSNDSTNPELELLGIPKPREFKESIRNQVRAARHREGIRATEFMESDSSGNLP